LQRPLEAARADWAQEGRHSVALFAVLRQMVYTSLLTNKRWRLRAAGALLTLSCTLVCGVRRIAASTETPARVRSTDAVVLELLREGAMRSATFRGLIDAISHSDGIVYVESGYCAFGHYNGCMLPFIASSHGNRYLRVVVTPDKNQLGHDQRIAIIAHELQHALEVIAHAEVVDVATMEAMYRRIGTPLTDGMTGYETSAARLAGDTVLSELLAQRRAPRTSPTSDTTCSSRILKPSRNGP
jgi:hypothetical protein